MKKDIKDYLHLYLGCEVVGTGKKPGSKHYTLVGVTFDGGCLFRTIPEGFTIDLGNDWKPILRPLSDMSEDEKLYIVEEITYSHVRFSSKDSILGSFDADRYNKKHNNELYPDEFLYLLKQGFDLFGLIESGLAIDKTKAQ